jgi:hypothetical protein
MQQNRVFFLFSAILLFTFASCKKNFSDEQYIEINNGVKPNLSLKVNTTVTGFINDENDKPVAGAQIIAGNKQAITDEYGYFKISNASLGKVAGFVKIVKSGYFTTYRTFSTVENKENFVRVKMLTKTETGVIDAASGGTVTAPDGAKVILPAHGIVIAGSGTPYTGQVHVSVRAIDVAATTDLQLATPGDTRGIDTSGYLKFLKSYTAVAVELTDASGERLQIATGSTATVTMPIAASLLSTAPSSIILWSLDETTGLWKQESKAERTGNNYVGTVSHFSFWDGAIGIALVNFKAQVVNAALQPLANVAVVITLANLPQNAGYGKCGFTDANGFVSGAIPANSNLVLDVMTTCANSAYSHTFSTTSSDVDLGTLTGNMGQSVVTITGTVTNCSNQPVTDGYVQTYDHGFYNRINIVNGNFSFTGLACTNTTVNYVVVDYATHQQNAPQSITLVPGVNNLGAITACGTSTIGTIVYTIDGVTRTLIEPTDTLAGYSLTPNPYTAIMNQSVTQNSPTMNFLFDGGNALGNGHIVSDIWSIGYPSGRAISTTGLSVNITEYGPIGGFISGSFSGVVQDFTTGTIHNVSYSFRIKRYN